MLLFYTYTNTLYDRTNKKKKIEDPFLFFDHEAS